jgi:hypothetical protein
MRALPEIIVARSRLEARDADRECVDWAFEG